MCKPLVSIIVPIYNTAEYLDECIRSVLSLTYQDVELILVNDGSTDDSGDICMRYADRSNVHYVAQENLGVSAARMNGVAVSHGEWLMFVDADDILPHDAVELLVSKTEGVDIVVGGNQHNVVKNEPDYIERDTYLIRMYQRRFTCFITTKLFRRSLFEKNSVCIPRQFVWEEDYLMNLRLAVINTKPICICQSPVCFRREDNVNSACHTFDYSLDYFVPFTRFAEELVDGVLSEKEKKKGAAIVRMHYCLHLLNKHSFMVDVNHPFFLETTQYLKEANLYRLSHELILKHPSKTTYAIGRFLARIENPGLLAKSIRRRFKTWYGNNA